MLREGKTQRCERRRGRQALRADIPNIDRETLSRLSHRSIGIMNLPNMPNVIFSRYSEIETCKQLFLGSEILLQYFECHFTTTETFDPIFTGCRLTMSSGLNGLMR